MLRPALFPPRLENKAKMKSGGKRESLKSFSPIQSVVKRLKG